jgi:molecular chaperone GrpE
MWVVDEIITTSMRLRPRKETQLMSEAHKNANESFPQSTEKNERNNEPIAPANQGQQPVEHVDDTPSSPQAEEGHQQVLAAVEGMEVELASLNRMVESRLRYDQVKEEAFERLYAELEDLKKNAAFEQLRPLYMDLILLFDRIENIVQDTGQSPITTALLSDVLETLSDELLEILYRREIEPINATGTFDPSVQQAIGTQPTAVEAENNQVARVVRRGFRYQDRILRAEEIIVKKYSATDRLVSTSEAQPELLNHSEN